MPYMYDYERAIYLSILWEATSYTLLMINFIDWLNTPYTKKWSDV